MSKKHKDQKKGPPFKPGREVPAKPDPDPDPTEPNPQRNDPTRIREPEKTDPTRIEPPPGSPPSPDDDTSR